MSLSLESFSTLPVGATSRSYPVHEETSKSILTSSLKTAPSLCSKSTSLNSATAVDKFQRLRPKQESIPDAGCQQPSIQSHKAPLTTKISVLLTANRDPIRQRNKKKPARDRKVRNCPQCYLRSECHKIFKKTKMKGIVGNIGKKREQRA